MRRHSVIPLLAILLACKATEEPASNLPSFQSSLVLLADDPSLPSRIDQQWGAILQLMLDPQGQPVVAWLGYPQTKEEMRTDQICVARWDGKQWVELGAGSTGMTGITHLPPVPARPVRLFTGDMGTEGRGIGFQIHAGLSGEPMVTWFERTGDRHFHMLQWTGEEWFTPDPITPETSVVALHGLLRSVSVDRENRLIAVWGSEDSGWRMPVDAMRLEDGQWQPLGDPMEILPEPWCTTATMTTDQQGNPVIVFHQVSRDLNQITVGWWDGEHWVGLDDPSLPVRNGFEAQAFGSEMALASGEGMHIAWNEDGNLSFGNRLTSGTTEVKLIHWDGEHWRGLGGSASEEGISRMLEVPGLIESINVRRMSADTSLYAGIRTLVSDPQGNPIVIWAESERSDFNYQHFAQRWNGEEWVDVWGGPLVLPGNENAYRSIRDVVVREDGMLFMVLMEISPLGQYLPGKIYQVQIPNWDVEESAAP